MGEAVVRRHALSEDLVFATMVVRLVRVCRSDHGYSIACDTAICGRRWSVTCDFSCGGQTTRCGPRVPDVQKVQLTKGELETRKNEAAGDVKSPAASVRVLWRCPTLPQPGGCSTIGAAGLSFQVRNGGWAFPRCYDHHKYWCSTRSPAVVWWGCGLIVVCIVVAAVLLVFFVHPDLLVGWLFSVGPLVPVGSRAHCCASTSGLSTR